MDPVEPVIWDVPDTRLKLSIHVYQESALSRSEVWDSLDKCLKDLKGHTSSDSVGLNIVRSVSGHVLLSLAILTTPAITYGDLKSSVEAFTEFLAFTGYSYVTAFAVQDGSLVLTRGFLVQNSVHSTPK